MTKAKRPLSPHLQVYKWGVHMAVSIMHRATGAVLAVGAILLVWWLTALATGPDSFNYLTELLASIPGQIVLFGITYAAMQHLASGIRHLIMDTGVLYDLDRNRLSARLVFAFAIVATFAIWFLAYFILGNI